MTSREEADRLVYFIEMTSTSTLLVFRSFPNPALSSAARTLFATALLAVAIATQGYAKSITAADASQAAVQAAINSAVSGDTVVVPAGSATWSTQVTCNKAITISGAGIDATIITGSVSATAPALVVTIPASGVFTLSGFTIQTAPSAQNGIVQMWGTLAPQYRVTNCKFIVAPTSPTIGTRSLMLVTTYGVVDHCTFLNTASTGQGMTFEGTGQAPLIANWNSPQPLGTQYANVVEDCTFTYTGGPADGAFDGYDGQKFVFRYNTVTGTNCGWHGADSSVRAPRLFEIYNNTFVNPGTHLNWVVRARGGTGVIHDNVVTGAWDSFFLASVYAADPTYSRNTWGLATGNNPVDGNQSVATYNIAYPLLDQVGRGSFPAGTPWPNQCTAAQYEALDPVYLWNNNFAGNTSPTTNVAGPSQSTNCLHSGVDYYDNVVKPGYTPLAYPHPLTSTTPLPPSIAKLSITTP